MMLLAHAFFKNLTRDNCEYGGWGVDSKRPFGNSDVEGDVLEIIGLEPKRCPHCDEPLDDDKGGDPRAYAAGLYSDLGPFLTQTWQKAYPEDPTDDEDG
jgi:hypothetical protein